MVYMYIISQELTIDFHQNGPKGKIERTKLIIEYSRWNLTPRSTNECKECTRSTD